jgi:antiviral defense system Shedu protein SduA
LFLRWRLFRIVTMDIDWDRPLQHRRGSPNRLVGIDIYYDFVWSEVFSNGRAQFRNGKSLARLVGRECPQGKRPALLLTTRDDVEERPIETDSEFVVVLNLRRYLQNASADAAASYYAQAIGSGITRIAQLHELASQTDVIAAVVERGLELEHIAAWAARRVDGIQQLRSIAGVADVGQATADVGSVVAALQALSGLDAEIIAAIEGVLGRVEDREVKLAFLRALTANRTGRYVTSEILGQRINERLGDARDVADRYAHLVDDPQSTETRLQSYIEEHPWLLGLDYAQVRPRRPLPRGQMDFILERYDGYHDLLELKSPQDSIVTAPADVDGVPPVASSFALSPGLAQALAQVHIYRDTMSADVVDRLYGLRNTRDPRIIIVIGRAGPLPDHRRRVLRELNLSLHRVEIVPYDVLASRARTILDNVERHLTATRPQDHTPR